MNLYIFSTVPKCCASSIVRYGLSRCYGLSAAASDKRQVCFESFQDRTRSIAMHTSLTLFRGHTLSGLEHIKDHPSEESIQAHPHVAYPPQALEETTKVRTGTSSNPPTPANQPSTPFSKRTPVHGNTSSPTQQPPEQSSSTQYLTTTARSRPSPPKAPTNYSH